MMDYFCQPDDCTTLKSIESSDGKVCWRLGAKGKSCDEVCEYYSDNKCIQENWDDGLSCTVCKSFLPGAGCWGSLGGSYTPGYHAEWPYYCISRWIYTSQSCSGKGEVWRRLCVCQY